MPLMFLCMVVDGVEEQRLEEFARGVEGHVVAARCVEQQCPCCINHMMMLIKEIRRCSSNRCVRLEFTWVGCYETP